MLIADLTNSGAMPVLEASVRFAGERQRLIAHNIANITTPDFRHVDVSPAVFQGALRKAVETRRAQTGGVGPLPLKSSQQFRYNAVTGQLQLQPSDGTHPGGNILAHDRNNRDVEQLMSDQAENAMAFRTSVELLRSRYEILRVAISERV